MGTSADKYTVDKFLKASVETFLKSTRVKQRFTTAFRIAYDSLDGPPAAASADAAAGPGGHGDESAGSNAAESAGSQKQESQAEKKHQDSMVTELSAFREQHWCEQHCLRELEARMVLLVADGTHAEIKASVTTTRLYQHLAESAPCMGFYDVKNAKLCNREALSCALCTKLCFERPVLNTF